MSLPSPYMLTIFVKCIAMTAWSCSKVIYSAYRNRIDRFIVDTYAKQWSHYIIKQFGPRYRIEGLETLQFDPGRAYIFMSNHVSMMDIVFANDACPPSLRFIAKKEVGSYPLFGAAMRAGEYVLIDRRNFAQAKLDLQLAKQKLQNGIKLWVYPEGTRSRSGDLLPFKKGAFHLAQEVEAWIVPVGLIGTDLLFGKRSAAELQHTEVRVRFGEPIPAAAYSKDQLAELIARTRSAIAALIVKTPSPT